eukprot:4628155-Lingulodinium_polyedra.AAC.1
MASTRPQLAQCPRLRNVRACAMSLADMCAFCRQLCVVKGPCCSRPRCAGRFLLCAWSAPACGLRAVVAAK